MAKPIKPTPILLGKDARNFYRQIESNKGASNPAQRESILKALTFISVDKPKSKN